MKKIIYLFIFISICLPWSVFAQATPKLNTATFTNTANSNTKITDYGDGVSKWTDTKQTNTADTTINGTPTFNEQGTVESGLYAGDDKYSYEDVVNKSKASGSSRTCQVRFTDIRSVMGFFICVIQFYIIPIVLTLMLLAYLYGNSKFILNTDNAEEMQSYKKVIIWMLLAMFIGFFIFAIVGLIGGVLGLDATILPQFNTHVN